MQLRLGRVRYCVKEIVTTPEDCEIYFEAAHPEEETSAQDLAESICKICYDKETEQQNPLLSLCQCESDEKFTHFLCLKQWLRSKVKQKNTDTSITYQWKSLECENCGTELPLSFWHRGSHFSLLDAEHPQCPHIVLEAFPLEDNLKCVHIIFIKTKTEITLGRAPDSDVRIKDISLSRLHATIKYEDGIFSLFDNDSKFGTLIQVLAPLQLTSSITLQAGKSLIHVETRDHTAEIRSGGEEVTNS